MKPLMTLPSALQSSGRTSVLQDRRKLCYFGGCDYFRMASHPQVLRALRDGLRQFGLNVSASRMTTGNHPVYERLERSLAAFFGSETATLAPNGWLPNAMVAQALAGQFSHVLLDERAHASLADAARLLDCPAVKFRHRDASDLAGIIRRLGAIKPLLMTDGMFSHDGSVAPLKEYLAVLPRGGRMLVDDAHGAGVLGRTGRGTPQHAGVSTARIIQTITLSKAFGVFGGAVLGPQKLRNAIIARSGIFTGSTPLPPPLACAALKSVTILRADRRLRRRLNRNVAHLRRKLRARGIPAPEQPGPIVSLAPRNRREGERLGRRLIEAGIHPPFILYPGGPENGYFRFAISSEHTIGQLDLLARVLVAAPANSNLPGTCT
jgi:7-keto-8-aminopelargonate synthetase-like enzyme